jgi:hypothetical protein
MKWLSNLLGHTTDAAVTDPAADASLTSLVKGILDRQPSYASMPTASVTRPATTPGAYTAGDVFGTAVTAVMEFASVARKVGGLVYLSGVRLIMDSNQAAPHQFRLWLFNAAPADRADHAALALSDAEILTSLGAIDLNLNPVAGNSAADAAGNTTMWVPTPGRVLKCGAATTSVWGIAQVIGATVPLSAEKATFVLCVPDRS